MDIATLGVNIDPTAAVKGADVATKAAYKMGEAFDRVVKSWQNGQNLLDNTFRAMVSGLDRLANAFTSRTGVIGSAFGAIVRSAAFMAGAVYNAMERAGKAFSLITGAAQSAAGAVGRAFGSVGSVMSGVLGSVTGSVRGIVNAFAQVGLAISGFQQVTAPITNFVGGAIDSAARMEGFENRWAFLLGTFDKAKAKMQELQQFANVTPFDLPGVTEAALAVERLTDETFKGQQALRRIGDAAAFAKQPIEEVAQRIVRLSGNLQRGAGGGDELRALTEWGIISPKVSAKLADMSTDAGRFKEAIALVSSELERSTGAMGLMATTWDGKVSTMSDAWNTFKTAIGTPIIEGLKPLIEDLTGVMDSLTQQALAMAPAIKEATLMIPAAFRVMQEEGGLKLAFAAATDYLGNKLTQLWEYSKAFLGATFKWIADNFTTAMRAIASEDFWKGVGKTLVSGVEAALDALTSPLGSMADKARADEAATRRMKEISLDIETRVALGEDITDLTKELKELNSGGGKSLLKNPEWKSFNVPSWGDHAQADTPSMLEFGKLVWDQLLNLSKESAAKEASNQSLVQKSAADRAAAAGSAGPDALSRKDIAHDAKMDKMAQGIIDEVDPAAKFEREKAMLLELRDTRKLTEDQYQAALKKTTADWSAAMKKRADDSKKASEVELTALQKLVIQWGAMKKNAQEATAAIAQSIGNNISGALTDWATGAKTAGQAFSDMARGIVRDIISIITKLWVQYLLSKALGMTAAGGAGLGGMMGGGGGMVGMLGTALSGGISSAFSGGGGGSSGGGSSSGGSSHSSGGSSSGGGGQSSGGDYSGGGSSNDYDLPDGGMGSGGEPDNMLLPPVGELHHGGMAGTGATRFVSPSVFAGASRYHRGGIAGLKSGEVPAVLQRGEYVVPRRETASAQKRALTGGGDAGTAGGGGVTIINLMEASQLPAMLAQHPGAILNIMAANAPTVRKIVQAG